MFRISPLLLALFLSFSAYSQCFQRPVSIQERVGEASIIAEGTVDSSYSVWNADHTLILTIHRFTVFKYFKGALVNEILEVVTLGGELEGELLSVEPELHLEKGVIGVLFLKQNNNKSSMVQGKSTYVPVAAEQGFIEYDIPSKSAFGPFDKYSHVPESLYPALIQATGKYFSEINSFSIDTYNPGGIKNKSDKILAVPVITSFSPSPITAGTNSVLTINGSNFGASYTGTANVEFKNANNGGSGYISIAAIHVVSWSDAQIQVKVPTQAGTGTIRVTNSTSESMVSGTNLTITYNQSNANDFEPELLNVNGAGGYTYVYSTATANNGISFDGHTNAKARFESALSNWRCNTGFNVAVGATTAIGSPVSDGVRVVMFDNDAAPLPAGVLGRAYSFLSSCNGTNWYAVDIDIVFKRDGTDGVTWYFGADPGAQPGGTSDFETVALHELGHNHQLGHTISPGAVMHYAITTGTNNRNLNAAQDIAGGNYVMSHSNIFAACSRVGMTNFNCALPPVANFSGTPLSSCNAPLSVSFSDLSTNAPTSWSWTFTGATPNSSTAQNPSNIVYNSSGTYSVTLTATNANGSDEEIKTGYITVGGSSIPLTTDFEGAFVPSGFSIVNADGFLTWQQSGNITGLSGASTRAAYMDCYDYNYNVGTTDDIVTLKYDLTSASSPVLNFDLAYVRYSSLDFERLQILISTDCGSTFPATLYNKSGSDADGNNLTTMGVAQYAPEFFPTAASHWRLETIDLSAYVGSVVMLKFRVTNGYGNNLFIDNINLSDAALPVTLESFNAVESGSAVKLNWKTTGNNQNEIYIVERSFDGRLFTGIISVNNSIGSNHYQVIDPSPGSGIVYYRLKVQEDIGFTYSAVVSVEMTSDIVNKDLILFPNPISSGEVFYFTSMEESLGNLIVFDLTGRYVENISINKKGSFVEISADVKPGVYFIEYRSEGLIRKGRILVK